MDEEAANDNWDYYCGASLSPYGLKFGQTMEIRVNAIRGLQKIKPVNDETARQMLVALFRFDNWGSLRRFHAYGDDASRWLDAKLRLVGGEHGYAIYKAMVSKKDTS